MLANEMEKHLDDEEFVVGLINSNLYDDGKKDDIRVPHAEIQINDRRMYPLKESFLLKNQEKRDWYRKKKKINQCIETRNTYSHN